MYIIQSPRTILWELFFFILLKWNVQTFLDRQQVSMFYSSDRKLQYQTDLMLKDQRYQKVKKFLIKQYTCYNDDSYKFVRVGSQRSPFSALITCNIHARQLITSQICIEFLKQLGNYKHSSILKDINFRVFYRGNNMRDKVLTEQGECQRKNKNQVDLNRNFPTDFNSNHSLKSSQVYSGPRPLSQPFSQCIEREVKKQKPNLFIDIHSGTQSFYHQEGKNQKQELQILNKIQKEFPEINIINITTLKADGQPINGHMFADLKVRKKVDYSFLFQVYGDRPEKNSKHQCIEYFNPLSQSQLQMEKQKWTSVLISTAQQVIKYLNKQNKQK